MDAKAAVPAAFREDRDLDLLQDDAHDASAVAGLEEERPVAGLADGARDESLGGIEDEATSCHVPTLYRNRAGPGRARLSPRVSARTGAIVGPGVRPQLMWTWIVSQPRAPSGAGGVRWSVWTTPSPSVARTSMTWSPGVASQ